MPQDDSAPILVFDVNETLLDITTLEPVFERVFGDRTVLREWFAQLILYSQTMTLSGLYTPFGELAIGALRMVADIHQQNLSDSDVDDLKVRMATMPALSDVEPALTRLSDAGFRLVTLTNSGASPSPSALQRAGLDRYFEHAFSVESVQRFKPAPETYRQVATEMGVDTSNLCLIACHLWDTIGVQAAGGHGALILRPHNALLPASGVPQPDFVAADLHELVQKILDRWPSR